MNVATSYSINDLIQSYGKWLTDNISYTQLGEWTEINVPFLDEDNDYTQIYVKVDDDTVMFSDDSYTLRRLESHGLTMTDTREQVLDGILRQFGVTRNGDELLVECKPEAFAETKNRFLQALSKVGDMSMMSQAHVQGYFADDVRDFFDANKIRYIEGAQFRGKSGFMQPYDFVLPRTDKQPERFCITLNRPSQKAIASTLFSWTDTYEARRRPGELIVFLNDTVKRVDEQVIAALGRYEAFPIKWSERANEANLYRLAS